MNSIEDSDFRLTIDNLDEACIQLPARYSHWYDKEADAKSLRDSLKDRVEMLKVDAELGYRSMSLTEINKDFSLSLKSLTEAAFKALVQSDSEVKGAINEYHAANRNYNIAMAKRRSLEQLKDLVDIKSRLWIKGFFYDGVIKEAKEAAYASQRSKVLKPKIDERKVKL